MQSGPPTSNIQVSSLGSTDMNIEVRPTPAVVRHRDRILGVLAAAAVAVTTLVAIAELAG